MTNQIAVAIDRAKPLFAKAAELHEQLVQSFPKIFEEILDADDKARTIGQCLESARLSLDASGVDVAFGDVLKAYAPNITTKQAEHYRRHSKTERKQVMLPFMPRQAIEDASDHSKREQAAAWERIVGLLGKMLNILRDVEFGNLPEEQRELIRDHVRQVERAMEGEL